jgi:hypothetical protein
MGSLANVLAWCDFATGEIIYVQFIKVQFFNSNYL